MNLIIDHLDIWTSAWEKKASGGRGGNGKLSPYGIQKLRELILELAVRGRLAPQDPNDEPASVLLEKIAEEKARLVKEGKIKKQKKLPEITDDEKPFDLPKGWSWVRLGEIAEIVRGITFPASEKSKIPEQGRIACLRTTNVQNRIDWDDLLFIREKFVKRSDQIISMNDIVMSMANSRELVGKVAIIDEEPKVKTTFGGFLGVLRPFQVNPYFLISLLRAPISRNLLIDSASQTTNIANISLGKLNPLVLGIPPLIEQHRIVAKVDELMALCDRLEQEQTDSREAHQALVETLLHTLVEAPNAEAAQQAWQRIAQHFDTLFTTETAIDQLKQTILQLAVMGKLVPQNPNDEPASVLLEQIAKEKARLVREGKIKKQKKLPEIAEEEKPLELPDGWDWVRVRDICHDWGQKKPDREFTYIDVSAIDNKSGLVVEPAVVTAEAAPSRARKIVRKDTVIYSTVRPYLKNIALISEDFDPEPIASTAFAIVHPFSGISGKYLVTVFRSPHFVRYVESVQTGIAYPAINDKQFFSAVVPLPPLTEQHRIVAKVDQLMTLCDALKARIQQAETTQRHLADAVVAQAVM